jgi:hypothetical protein
MSNATRIALIGGQGWPVTETAAGLPALQQRLTAQGVEVQTFAPSIVASTIQGPWPDSEFMNSAFAISRSDLWSPQPRRPV